MRWPAGTDPWSNKKKGRFMKTSSRKRGRPGEAGTPDFPLVIETFNAITHPLDQKPLTSIRSTAPAPAQKTLEVSIPEQAVPSLIMRSGHKLAQIGEVKSRCPFSL